MLSVVIIDDEAPARRYLRRLLEAAPDVHVTGEASTIEQAWRLVRECRPDAIFLDIELTCGTGFDLLPMLSPAPAVVFVTAHSDHAARAFDVEAVDYLLKPVDPDRLAQTLARLRPRASGLAMRTRSGKRFIKVQDLTVAQAQGDYAPASQMRCKCPATCRWLARSPIAGASKSADATRMRTSRPTRRAS